MSRLRLSASASATEARTGLILKSDLGTFQLEGADLAAFVRGILPLIDGTKSAEQIADSLPDYTRSSVLALLEQLEGRGLVEPADSATKGGEAFASANRFLKRWIHDPQLAVAKLQASRVIIVGLEPWGLAAARGLLSAGIGALDLRDDGVVTQDDLTAMVGWRSDDLSRPRATAAQALLARLRHRCWRLRRRQRNKPSRAGVNSDPDFACLGGAFGDKNVVGQSPEGRLHVRRLDD